MAAAGISMPGVDDAPLAEARGPSGMDVALPTGPSGGSYDSKEVPRQKSTTAAEEIVKSFLSSAGQDDLKQFLCLRCSGNVMVLLLTTFLFALITTVQYYFGAVVTHSQALLADCNCMAVDTLSYFLNIFAELAPPRFKRKLQLVVPILSLSVLAYLTVKSAQDALCTINSCEPPDPDEPDVNAWIVWAFGFGGLLFDCISIYAFCKNKKRTEGEGGKLPVNMLAAFMHVGADFIRSATTTVEGFFLIAKQYDPTFLPSMDGDVVDAYSCMVITVVIVLALVYGFYEVIHDIVTYLKTGE